MTLVGALRVAVLPPVRDRAAYLKRALDTLAVIRTDDSQGPGDWCKSELIPAPDPHLIALEFS